MPDQTPRPPSGTDQGNHDDSWQQGGRGDRRRGQGIPKSTEQIDQLEQGDVVPGRRVEGKVAFITAAARRRRPGRRDQLSGKLRKALQDAIAAGDLADPTAAPAAAMLGRAAALGAATGLRSTVALAALILRRSDGLPAVSQRKAARLAAAIADAGELVIDKLPMTRSRLDPPGLTTRAVSASLAAAVLARSGHRRLIP